MLRTIPRRLGLLVLAAFFSSGGNSLSPQATALEPVPLHGAGELPPPATLRRASEDGAPGRGSVTDPDVVGLLGEYLKSPAADVRASALSWITRDPRAQDDTLVPSIFAALKDGDSSVRNEALRNMGWVFERPEGPGSSEYRSEALRTIVAALKQTSDRAARLVAVDLLRGSAQRGEYDTQTEPRAPSGLITIPEIQSLLAALLADPGSALRAELLEVVRASRSLQALPTVIVALGKALRDDSLTVRSDTADILIQIHRNGQPAVRSQARSLLEGALEENDPNVQMRVSRALGVPVPPRRTPPAVLSLTGEAIVPADAPFDFNYYTAFVQPLFVKKRGNEACVDCHTPEANTSGLFRILAPRPDGRYTLAQSRVNFVSVLANTNRKAPERSKLLLKPLDPRTREGSLRGTEHDGGVFWADQFDPDFQMIQAWVKGAKLDTPPEKQLDFAYFIEHIEPILSTPAPDGFACINCHSTHAILHLESPETREGKFSVAQLRNNYESAHRVIDEAAPGNSFIVRKPTSLREGEPGGIPHAGGIRWPERKNSWQYKTLITWMGKYNLARDVSPP